MVKKIKTAKEITLEMLYLLAFAYGIGLIVAGLTKVVEDGMSLFIAGTIVFIIGIIIKVVFE